MDITNKSLAFLLVMAIAVSVGGTLVSLNRLSDFTVGGVTGQATASGTTNFTINSSVSCAFNVSEVDFGYGTVAALNRCAFDTNGTNPTANCNGFNSAVAPFVLNNTGNENVTVRLASNSTAAQFLYGSASPVFRWFGEENTTSCSNLNGTLGQWTTVTTTNVTLCDNTTFNYVPGSNALNIHINANFSGTITTGAHQATITAFCDNP